jgi:hypothetical protein
MSGEDRRGRNRQDGFVPHDLADEPQNLEDTTSIGKDLALLNRLTNSSVRLNGPVFPGEDLYGTEYPVNPDN